MGARHENTGQLSALLLITQSRKILVFNYSIQNPISVALPIWRGYSQILPQKRVDLWTHPLAGINPTLVDCIRHLTHPHWGPISRGPACSWL
jgi:hypothetical protein